MKQSLEPRVISNLTPVYGAKTRPRTAEPDMFQLINCRTNKFDETRNRFREAKNADRLRYIEIDKPYNSDQHFMSETQDQFRPFVRDLSDGMNNHNKYDTPKEIVLCFQEGDNEPVYIRFDTERAIEEFLLEVEQKRKEREMVALQNKKKGKKETKGKHRPVSVKKPILNRSSTNKEAERIKKFDEQTRWLANTSYQTYYGKPAFENYGMGNTHPVWGGVGYGSYLKTFNINPQRGSNRPPYEQVFTSSAYASFKMDYDKSHLPRKCKEEFRLSDEAIERQKNRLKLMPEKKHVMSLGKLQKPDLAQTDLFRSDPDYQDYEQYIEKENNVIEEIKGLKTLNKRVAQTNYTGDDRDDVNEPKPDSRHLSNRQVFNTIHGNTKDNKQRSPYNPEKYIEKPPQISRQDQIVGKVVRFAKV